jgi:hypothetical protein
MGNAGGMRVSKWESAMRTQRGSYGCYLIFLAFMNQFFNLQTA